MYEHLVNAVALVGGSLGILKTTADLGRDVSDMVREGDADPVAVHRLLGNLIDEINRAKRMHAEVEDALLAIQRELRERDDFAAVLARYELRDTGRGAMVLRLKASAADGEPDHCICPSCANRRQREVLQPKPTNPNFMLCPHCKAEFLTTPRESQGAMSVPVARSRRFDEGLRTGYDVLRPYDDD